MEFDIIVKKDKYNNWYYTYKQIIRYFPEFMGTPVLPLKVWQKYHYFNINFMMILPNHKEIYYNNQLFDIPNSFEYPQEVEFQDYKKFTDIELFGDKNIFIKNNTIMNDYTGNIIQECDDIYIIDNDTYFHKITNIIPYEYLTFKSWKYYNEYCIKNSVELYTELNKYFRFNFYQFDVNANDDY